MDFATLACACLDTSASINARRQAHARTQFHKKIGKWQRCLKWRFVRRLFTKPPFFYDTEMLVVTFSHFFYNFWADFPHKFAFI